MSTEQFKDDDKLLKELFHRSSSTPDEALKTRILQNVMIKKEVFEYQPVIGKKGWITIAIGFLALIMLPIVSNYSGQWNFSPEKWIEFEFLQRLTMPDGLFELQMNQVPSAFLTAMVALIVFGLYFIISFKLGRKYLG